MAKGWIRGVLTGSAVACTGVVALLAAMPLPQRAAAPEPVVVVQAANVSAVMPAAVAPVAPRPAMPPPQLAAQTAPLAPPADAAPARPMAPPVREMAQAVPPHLPANVAPVPPRRAMADARPVTAPVARAWGGADHAVPVPPFALLAETAPVAPQPAGPPVQATAPVAAAPAPASRPLALDTPATLPVAREAADVLTRSETNPALVLEGAAVDAPPPGGKPTVLRPGADGDLAQAEPVLKKPAPLAPAPGLKTAGAPATEGTLTAQPAAATPAQPAADAPPRVAFARPFENPAQKPLVSVVLFDTGDPALDRTALASMPFPVTFVLDPTKPESALAASIYREGGQEVAMLATGIPAGATASDVEVTFGAHATALAEAVAVVVPETDGFQDNRPVATMVVPVVAAQGRGLLSWDRGLNAADQVARREGAYAATIFRRLDGKGEDTARIRQYLDRAAFKAAQEGRVVVAGDTRPETMKALLEWAVEGRASTVALAPLTAAMQAQ